MAGSGTAAGFVGNSSVTIQLRFENVVLPLMNEPSKLLVAEMMK